MFINESEWQSDVLDERRATRKLRPEALALAHGLEPQTAAIDNSPNIQLTREPRRGMSGRVAVLISISYCVPGGWVDILPKTTLDLLHTRRLSYGANR